MTDRTLAALLLEMELVDPAQPGDADILAARLIAAGVGFATENPTEKPAEGHQPGDLHNYRVACSICGEPGYLRVSWVPERTALAKETDRVPCPHCPHWMSHHNPDGSCGCGATHPEPAGA